MDRRVGEGKESLWALLYLALMFAALGKTHALAFRGPPAEMSLSDIPIGRAFDAAGRRRPMGFVRVTNTGDEPIELHMRLAATRPENLKDGYEPLGDLSWVSLARPRLKIPPGQEGESSVLVSLPDDKNLLGGQFELEWIGEARSPDGAELGLRSKLLLRVARDDARSLEARRKTRGKGVARFMLSPPEGMAENVPLGRRLDLRELGVALKLINPNPQEAAFVLTSFSIDTLDIKQFEEGFSPGPNPNFLRPASPVVSVGPDGVGEARFFLKIPDQHRYRNRSWVFAVKVEPLGAGDAAAKDFRLLVTTQREAAM